MNSNIFQGAKFGDKFVTRDGRIAIYHYYSGNNMKLHKLILENGWGCACKEDGHEAGYKESNNDIISRYQKPIDEKKLDELAEKYFDSNVFDGKTCALPEVYLNQQDTVKEIFKSGYRKAKEE